MPDTTRRQFLKLAGLGIASMSLPAAVISKDAKADEILPLTPYHGERVKAKKGSYIYNEAKREILTSGPLGYADLHAQLLAEPPYFDPNHRRMTAVRLRNDTILDPTPIVSNGDVQGACFFGVLSPLTIGAVAVYSEHSQIPFIFSPVVPLVPNGSDILIQWEHGLFVIE